MILTLKLLALAAIFRALADIAKIAADFCNWLFATSGTADANASTL